MSLNNSDGISEKCQSFNDRPDQSLVNDHAAVVGSLPPLSERHAHVHIMRRKEMMKEKGRHDDMVFWKKEKKNRKKRRRKKICYNDRCQEMGSWLSS